jgi:hypothetical protein
MGVPPFLFAMEFAFVLQKNYLKNKIKTYMNLEDVLDLV